MKKIIIYVLMIIFSLSAPTAVIAGSGKKIESANSTLVVKKGEKLSDKDWNRIANRVEEIRHMDRSNLTAEQRLELRKELRGYREQWRDRDDGYRHGGGTVVIFGGGTVLLIIILIIILA
jgi:hypothetical protein